jgi:hypothetical protein
MSSKSVPIPDGRRLVAGWVQAACCALLTTVIVFYLSAADFSEGRYRPSWCLPLDQIAFRQTNWMLGAESLCVAQSLRAGKGYADPFQRDAGNPRQSTGPTAWVAPAYPAVIYVALSCVADRPERAAVIVVLLKILSMTIGAWWVCGRCVASPSGPWTALAIYITWLGLYAFEAFQITDDGWLVTMTVLVVVSSVEHCLARSTLRSSTICGALLGLSAMVSPIVCFAGAVTVAVEGRKLGVTRMASLVGAAVLALLPWTVRNAATMGALVPVKSNLFFEIRQSLDVPGGVLRGDSFGVHPFTGQGKDLEQMHAVGETAALASIGRETIQRIRQFPNQYLRGCLGRLGAVTFIHTSFVELPEHVLPLWLGNALYPVPALALAILLIPGRRMQSGLRSSCFVIAYLLVYVLTSYYERYGFPIVPLQVFIVCQAIDRIVLGIKKYFTCFKAFNEHRKFCRSDRN